MPSCTSLYIRNWQPGDEDGVWNVLKEGSFSNVNSTFFICLNKTITRVLIVCISCAGIAAGFSIIFVVLFVLVSIIFVYLISLCGAFVYLYSLLSDMKNIHESYFKSSDTCFWVAEYNNEIAGTIAIVQKQGPLIGSPSDSSIDQESSAKVAWLRRMAVGRQYRGLGIAKALVHESLSFCRSQGYTKVFLITTEVHHAARALYSSLGFQLIACRPYTYLNGLVKISTYEYELKLS